MAVFKDCKSREWIIELDGPKLHQVRRDADDRFLIGEPIETLARLEADPATLCLAIRSLCLKHTMERGVTDEDFYAGLKGDALDAATEALLDAVLNFIPSRQREKLLAGATKNRAIQDRLTARAIQAINDPQLEEAIVAKVELQLQKILTPLGIATGSPASLESAPTD